jgi:hypothetical protein
MLRALATTIAREVTKTDGRHVYTNTLRYRLIAAVYFQEFRFILERTLLIALEQETAGGIISCKGRIILGN